MESIWLSHVMQLCKLSSLFPVKYLGLVACLGWCWVSPPDSGYGEVRGNPFGRWSLSYSVGRIGLLCSCWNARGEVCGWERGSRQLPRNGAALALAGRDWAGRWGWAPCCRHCSGAPGCFTVLSRGKLCSPECCFPRGEIFSLPTACSIGACGSLRVY